MQRSTLISNFEAAGMQSVVDEVVMCSEEQVVGMGDLPEACVAQEESKIERFGEEQMFLNFSDC